MEICYKRQSHTLRTLGDKVIRLYSAMIGRLSMPTILDSVYKRFVISSQFCVSINFVPITVALACNFTPSALLCIQFRRIFVLHQLLLSTEQFYPTHNIQHPPTSLYATLFVILCCYHCCFSISSQGVHSPAHCA